MEKLTLNQKEQKRLFVFKEMWAGRMTGQEEIFLKMRHNTRLTDDSWIIAYHNCRL